MASSDNRLLMITDDLLPRNGLDVIDFSTACADFRARCRGRRKRVHRPLQFQFYRSFSGIHRLSDIPQRETRIPGHGRFEVQIMPLSDRGYKFIYAQDISIRPGTAEPVQVPFDLNETVRRVAAQRRASPSSSSFEIKLELAGNLPRSVGYPSQIERAITSLFVHAEDAISMKEHRHGAILIQTRARSGRVQVQVADNGQSRNTARIFTLDSSGVGLNACAKIAEDHGGELYAWSTGGVGSTLTLELPAYPGDMGSNARASIFPEASRLLRNKSVMVVDDEVHITELIHDVLTRHGADVQVSNSGSDAYEHLYSKEYDLIICDPSMPGLSGDSLCRLIKSVNPSRNPQFLFTTGDAAAVQAGVPCLMKPFRIQALMDVVEGLVSRSPKRDF